MTTIATGQALLHALGLDHIHRSAAEHLRQISPRGWRAPRAELLMRARSGP